MRLIRLFGVALTGVVAVLTWCTTRIRPSPDRNRQIQPADDRPRATAASSMSGRCRPASPPTTRRPASYTPFRMEKNHFSSEWDDAPMPNSIFFTQRGHAIHGTDYRPRHREDRRPMAACG